MAIRLRRKFKTSAKKDMSRIHWKLRKKGYGFSKAFRLARDIKGLAWKFKRRHAYKDYDRDGVVNKYDCQPRNRWKQDGISDEELDMRIEKLGKDTEKTREELRKLRNSRTGRVLQKLRII